MGSKVKAVGKYFRGVRAELRKVSWPGRKELTTFTSVVLATVVGVGLMLWLVDSLLSQLLKLVL